MAIVYNRKGSYLNVIFFIYEELLACAWCDIVYAYLFESLA